MYPRTDFKWTGSSKVSDRGHIPILVKPTRKKQNVSSGKCISELL